MTRLRANLHVGSWLALFALAVQLVLSFGHVHLGTFAPSKFAVHQSGGTAANPPAGTDHEGAADDFCAICATISLVSNSVTPSLAVLAIPVSYFQEWNFISESRLISFGIEFLFRARAPPRSI
jgi:hypothetical protein